MTRNPNKHDKDINNYSDKVTVLVNSCDKYSDAWHPFFSLLKLQWPECENYRIILNTETKIFDCDFLNVETVCGGYTAWSKRIKNVLKKIDSEIVVFLLEDFFLKTPTSQKDFIKTVELMLEDKTIGYVGAKYRPDRILKDGTLPSDWFISRDVLNVNCYVPLISSIWNRKFFIKLIRNHETPWEFEAYAGQRAKRYGYKVLDINNNIGFSKAVFDYDIDMQYGIGIAKGKWLMPKTKEFLDKYGFDVNYDNLGTDNETYFRAIGELKDEEKCRTVITKDPLIIHIAYRGKKFFVKLPEKIKNSFRKIKSLI